MQFILEELRKRTQVPIIAIYKHPKDYPDKYVARVFDIDQPTFLAVTADTLEEIRGCIPEGMRRVPRSELDAKEIVESWIMIESILAMP